MKTTILSNGAISISTHSGQLQKLVSRTLEERMKSDIPNPTPKEGVIWSIDPYGYPLPSDQNS